MPVKRITLLTLVVFLSSCATPIVMLVHPKTGDVRRCSAVEVGVPPSAIGATTLINNCVQQWELLGYIQADKLTPEQRSSITPKP